MALNERKHPDIIETKLDLNESQQTAFNTLRQSLSPDYDHITDYTLYRFLKVSSFYPETAESAFKTYIQWRADKHLDTVLDTPPRSIDVINKLVPYAYHGYDVDGRPIYMEKTGKIHCGALADETILSRQDFLDSHVWGMENLLRKCHQSSLQRKQRVETFTSLLDMEGLGFHHRVALPLLHACMTLDSTYYPEFIGKLYVINTPWVAPYLYQAATPFVPAEVRARVHVLNDLSYLKQMIPPRHLPPAYGGSCTSCEGGCLVEHDASAITALARKPDDDGMIHHYISSDYSQSLSCDNNGGTFSWFFEITDGEGYDIDFSVSIQDSNGIRYAKQPSRCATNRGSYTAKESTTVVLKWDNSFSWMNGKNIVYMFGVVKIDVEGGEAAMSGA